MSTLFTVEPQPANALPFPESLTAAYRPQTMDEFCGLEKQRRILTNLGRNPRPCGLLFEGGPGTGKTSMAFAFARELAAEVHHVSSQECNLESLKAISAMCHRVPYDWQAGKPCRFHAVIIDEADLMSSAAQNYLLSKLDGSEQCPNTAWIFTCNSTDRLEDRFLSRCIKLPKFNTYGASGDIRAMLARIWAERAGHAAEPDYSVVPTSNIRESLQWLETELLSA